MPRRFARLALITFAGLLTLAPVARANEYPPPTWSNVLKAMVRMNALDISDNRLLDEYGIISECPLYTTFYKDDFKWNKVRNALREDIHNHIAIFPTGFAYRHRVNLGRYDFHNSVFEFSPATPVHNVNSFELFKTSDMPCGPDARIHNIPTAYRAILDSPIYLIGLPMSKEDAQALNKRMSAAQNDNRTIYAQFNLAVTFIEPLHPFYTPNALDAAYVQGTHLGGDPMQIDVHLESIDFYEDEAMTQLLYEFKQ